MDIVKQSDELMEALTADMVGTKARTVLVGPLNIDDDGVVILSMAHNFNCEDGYVITLWEIKDNPIEVRIDIIEELGRVFTEVYDIDDKITFIANIGSVWKDQDMTALSLKLGKQKRADADKPAKKPARKRKPRRKS